MTDLGGGEREDRRPDKAPGAFRTISEAAAELDVPQHVLRFWESKFSQIRPLKRGGGRRYYRPEDIDLLRGIRRLLYGDGYTIKGVQRLLREQGARSLASEGRESLPEPQRVAPPPAAGDRNRAIRHALVELGALRDILRRRRL